MTSGWSTPADIRAKVRRSWDDGSLLSAYVAAEPFPARSIALRGPTASQIGADLGAAQAWVAALTAGQREGLRYTLELGTVGGRLIGRNDVPTRAHVTSYEQAWHLLGVTGEVRRLDEILALTADAPTVRDWVRRHPLKAIAFDDDWVALVSAVGWLEQARGTRRYLREISAPGVDTKFVERNRSVLASMLGTVASASGFAASLGLAGKPETVRLRFDAEFAGFPRSLSEGTFRLGELAQVRVGVASAVLVENETTFLSVPVPAEGVVIWGRGFDVGKAGSLPWLRDADVHYWGDLDTHGFAILHRLRSWLPQAQSFLMDRETLLAHRDRWVPERSPTRARLDRLTAEERELFGDLVSDRLGDRVRLEQERVDWEWAVQRLPYE